MSVENDKLLIDHNYDGIQEYDNPLPRWWVVLFWVTIVLTPVYLLYYHAGPGKLAIDQYNDDMIAYYDMQAQQIAAMGEITESTFVDLQSNESMMAGAAQLFVSKCAQCHGPDGQGGIGPNLTDDYWLHGGQMTDIYHTVTEGVVSKGMLAWKNQLSLAEILSVASYVGSLRGSDPPNPKDPQGEFAPWVPPTPADPAAESEGAGSEEAEPAAADAEATGV
jgi:cytochrome c oxidase cbb3-type subunit 3